MTTIVSTPGGVDATVMRAEDPETPVDELERLTRHRSRLVRAAVAANANASTEILETLSRVFPEDVARNPILDWLLLEDANWLGTFDSVARHRLLVEPDIAVGLLWWGARFGDTDDQQAVAQNPKCPAEILSMLAESGYPPVELAAKAHVNLRTLDQASATGAQKESVNGLMSDLTPETPDWAGSSATGLDVSILIDMGVVPTDLFGALIGGDVQVRRSIAASPQATPRALAALMLDDDDTTRELARAHASVPHDVLDAIDALEANRPDAQLDALVGLPFGSRAELLLARHANCPEPKLMEFADNPNWRLREAVAANPSVDIRIMAQLASDNDKDVRVSLTTNASLPRFLLGLLAEDRVEEVSASARRRITNGLTGSASDGVEVEHTEAGRDALLALLDTTPGVSTLIGRHRLVPVELLRTLAVDTDWRVRVACAGNPSAPIDVLDRLMRDTDSDVRTAALNNPAATDDLVKNVADPAHPEVRRRLVRLATSPAHLDAYTADIANVVRIAVAEHELATPSTLETLASDTDETVRQCVASRESLTRAAIIKLAADTEPPVQQRIAERNDLPDEAVVQLFHDKRQTGLTKRADQCRKLLSGATRTNRSDIAVLRAAPSWLRQHVIRRSSDASLLKAMAVSDDWYTRVCVVQHPLLTDTLLQTLATDSDYDVRTAVASLDRSLPHNVVHDLSQDPHTAVRAAVLARPDLEQCVVEEMIYDEDDELRAAVASHPRLSDQSRRVYQDLAQRNPLAATFLKDLAGASPLSRRLVAQHPDTPVRVLGSLSRDENWRVREDVARHPKATGSILQRLGTEADRDVRRAVATNPSTPAKLLCELIVDTDDSVRIAASRHPRLPQHLRADIQRSAVRKLARSRQPHDRLVFIALRSCSSIELRKRRHWQASEWQIRHTVATHTNTPPNIVERLANDADYRVRAVAQQRLADNLSAHQSRRGV